MKPSTFAKFEQSVTMSHGRTRYFDAGSGKPCIFLHGVNFTAGGTNWLPVIESLAGSVRVIAPDFLGWGAGDRLEQGYSFAYLVDFVRELQDCLHLDKSHVVGHSMGGWIASLLAYESPHRVDGLVLVDSGGLANRSLPSMTQFKPPTRDELQREIESRISPDIDCSVVTEWEWQNTKAPHALSSYRKILQHMNNPETRLRYNTLRRLPYISSPTLVIWGEHDQVNDIELGRRTADLIPNAELAVLNCGHFVPSEKPHEFYQLVSSFFTELDGIVL